MNSTTIALALVLGGALLLYAAWTKRGVRNLLAGDAAPGTGGYA